MHQDIYQFFPPPTFYLSYIPGWESGSHVQTCRLLLNAGRMENLIPISAFQTHCEKCSFPLHLQKMHFPFELAKNALLFWKNQTAQVRFHNFLMGKM